jgi:hypothetical protein
LVARREPRSEDEHRAVMNEVGAADAAASDATSDGCVTRSALGKRCILGAVRVCEGDLVCTRRRRPNVRVYCRRTNAFTAPPSAAG